MNIKNNNKKPLFESQQQVEAPEVVQQQQRVNIESVLDGNMEQFKFDCGAIMAGIKVDTGNKFGLRWHREHSEDVESFIASVNSFITAGGNNYTENDDARLRIEYENY